MAETDGIPLEPEKEEAIVFARKGREAEMAKRLVITVYDGLVAHDREDNN